MSDVHNRVQNGDNAAKNTKTDPIKHVVLLLMENHSFDQMLGSLDAVHEDLDGIKNGRATINDDGHGKSFRLEPTQERQMKLDPYHDHPDVLEQLAGNNGGFVRNFARHYPRSSQAQRQDIMGYYPLDFLPALHTLGRQFTICDRWFSSLPGPTWPNRFFALSGTSMGEVAMPEGINALEPKWYTEETQTTIFDRLNEKQKSWKVYFYDFPASLLLVNQRKRENLANYHSFGTFFEDAAADESTFPEFVLIEPKYFGQAQNDDHPPHNIMKAEKLIADTGVPRTRAKNVESPRARAPLVCRLLVRRSRQRRERCSEFRRHAGSTEHRVDAHDRSPGLRDGDPRTLAQQRLLRGQERARNAH
ncbi:alkaline phosphatase family protein [Trinickia violacea]|uniref:alkaline phosphatase family protein n=1 Tax=Trinickia violacea TaxID=2571746 RepID=UPI0026A657F4